MYTHTHIQTPTHKRRKSADSNVCQFGRIHFHQLHAQTVHRQSTQILCLWTVWHDMEWLGSGQPYYGNVVRFCWPFMVLFFYWLIITAMVLFYRPVIYGNMVLSYSQSYGKLAMWSYFTDHFYGNAVLFYCDQSIWQCGPIDKSLWKCGPILLTNNNLGLD